jgi:ATP-dependent protease ClpP protease subunit
MDMKKLLLMSLVLLSLTAKAQPLELKGRVSNESIDLLNVLLENQHHELAKDEAIYITLNSPGGSVYAGMKLLNKMRAIQSTGRKIVGVVEGFCASMCFCILQAMDERLAYPFSIVMQHRVSPAGKHATALEIMLERMEAEKIGLPLQTWRLMTEAVFYFDSVKAKRFNMIDGIVVEKITPPIPMTDGTN